MNQIWLQQILWMEKSEQTKQVLQYKQKLAAICTGKGQKQTNKSSPQYKPKFGKTGTGY